MTESAFTDRRRLSRRQLLKSAGIGGLGLVGLATVGCGSDGGSGSSTPAPETGQLGALEEAAKQEGRVTWYTSLPPTQADAVAEAFRKKYGVEVEVQRLNVAPLLQRFASEAESGTAVADILTQDDPQFFADSAGKGWIATIQRGELPGWDEFPEQFKSSTGALTNIPLRTIGYNTGLVKGNDVPKDWPDLLDSKFNGKILLVDPRTANVHMALMYFLRETYGDDFLRQFGRQVRLVNSGIPGAQQVAAGEASVLVPNNPATTAGLVQQGAPIADVIPDKTIGAELWSGIAGKAPHPNAARLFFNYLLTAEGQSVMNKDVNASARTDAAGTLPLPSGYQSPKRREAETAAPQLLSLLGIQ